MSLSALFAAMLAALIATGLPMRVAAWMTPRAAAEVPALRYGEGPRAVLDLALPAHVGPDTPVVVFFHGGGWRGGSRADYAFLARALAAEGFAVALPDYRLWPAARWPDFLEDGARAVAWLRGAEARAAGVPAGPVFVMGHSAGGFIAAALALDPRWLEAAGPGRETLAGAILVSAPIAWQPEEEPTRSIFAAAPGGRIEAAPDPATIAGAPPLLLVHGQADTVVGPFHSKRLAAAVAEAGGASRLSLQDGMDHIAPMIALSAPARRYGWAGPEVWNEVLGFLRGVAQ